jgi:hypothetical protein
VAFIDGADNSGAQDAGPAQETQPAGSDLSTQGQSFIDSIPEEHRDIVRPYVSQWDSGFQKYARGVQEKLKNYESLGPHEELVQARNLQQMLMTQPDYIVDYLFQNRDDLGLEWRWNAATQQMEPQQTQPGAPEQDPLEPKFKQFFQPYEEKLGQYDKVLGVIADWMQRQEQAETHKRQDEELQQAISSAREKHGDFDLNTVLSIARAQNVDIDQAVILYKTVLDREVSARTARQAPIVLGAQSLPQMQKSALDMTADERKNLMASYINGMQT